MGRSFVVVFEHGEDFFLSLRAFCDENRVDAAYIPTFIAGFSAADVVGTCQRLEDSQAPVWSSVHLRNVEALGGGTVVRDDAGELSPHLHVSVGLKEHSATAHTSHLLSATVQFLTEMILVEITNPPVVRRRDPELYDVPLLRFNP